jgi:RNA polymerase sigma factor for flagellar operon FliA
MSTAPRTPEQLIADCQGLVRSLAWKIHRKVPKYVDLDDLIGYGQIGLAEAAREFDASRGGQFTTYAHYRIRGAILDGLCKITGLTRAQYARMKYDQMAGEVLRQEAEDPGPSGTVEDDARWLTRVSGNLAMVYLSTLGGKDEEGGTMEVADRSAADPALAAMGNEAVRKLHQLIRELPPDSAALIRAAYFEGLTLKEAGERIGVSKAWASRLHARTLERLARSLLAAGVGEGEGRGHRVES